MLFLKRPHFVLLGLLGVLLVCFQNFSHLTLSDLKPRFNQFEKGVDARHLVPSGYLNNQGRAPTALSANATAHEIADKMWQQNEYAQRLNKYQEQTVRELNQELGLTEPSKSISDAALTPSGPEQKRMISNVRFTRINALAFNANSKTDITCAIEGQGLEVKMHHPLSETSSVDVRYQGQDSGSAGFSYSW